jgi:hypothetical protein
MRHPLMFAALAVCCVACAQKAVPISEAQLVGKWACDPSFKKVSDGTYEQSGVTEWHADHTIHGVSTTSFTGDKGSWFSTKHYVEDTWRLEGDAIEFTTRKFELLSSDPPFSREALEAIKKNAPSGAGTSARYRITAFDGKQRVMRDDGWFGNWFGDDYVCRKL